MEPAPKPTVAVIGGGAIGAVMVAALVDAGHSPWLCVRTPIPSFVIESNGVTRKLPVTIVADPEAEESGDLGPVDWVLVTVKAQDTAGAASWLGRLCGPGTVVVALQNGLDHVSRLTPYVGGATVLPTQVYIAAERVAPGRVVHRSGRRVAVPADEHGAHFAQLVEGSGLDVVQEPDMLTSAWRKLFSNLVANPLTALTMRRMDVMTDPGIGDLAQALMAEALQVAQAEGAQLGQADINVIFQRFTGLRTSGGTGSSMYYDRLAGRSLEHEELTGALVTAARRHGIPTPYNDVILALLRALDRSRTLSAG